MKRFSIAFLLVSLCAVFAFAQGTTGRLAGTVSGPDGVLPGATVVVRDNATGKETTVTTNEQGGYIFSQLEFGTYTVRVSASGFKTLVANDQKIDVGRDATLNATLEIGDVTAEVVVTAGADVITSDTAQVSNTVSPQQILSLPLITRSPLSLTTLQAGVSSNSAQNTTINGLRTTFTNITRDGINIQDTFIRSNATDFAPGRPSVDDTAEFTITTTNQEADQGYGGAQIRLVTPRGTKDFNGALFAYNRNSAFAANSFFNNRTGAARPYRNRNQYGGKASWRLPVPGLGEGTPMLFWDKAFWFFAYEKIKDPVSQSATRTILSPTAQAGAFTWNRTNATDVSPYCPSQTIGSVCTIPNILTFGQTVFPTGNIRSTISPYITANVLAGMPTTSNFTGGDGLNTRGYRFNRAADQERDQYSTRVDVDVDDKNSLLFIYNYNEEVNLRPDIDATGFSEIPDGIQASNNKQFTTAYRRVFTSNFVNEFRYGLFTSEVPFDRLSEPTQILAVPLISSPNTFVDQGRNTKAFNFQSNGDYIWGKHTFRFGGQAQWFKVNAYNDVGTVPTVTIGNTAGTIFQASNFNGLGGISTTQLGTANGLLTLLGGHFNTVGQSFNVTTIEEGFVRGATEFRPFRYENHALYFADRWQAARGLTLSLGVRYEIFPALRNTTGRGLEPLIRDLDNPIASLMDPNGVYVPLGQSIGSKDAYYKTDYNNIAPNLGVAWTPSFTSGFLGAMFGDGKSVLRAGYSQVYGNDSIVTSVNNASIGNAGLARTAVTLGGLVGRIDTDPVPVVPAPSIPALPRPYLVNNGPGIGNYFGTVFAVDPKLQTPMVEQYNVGWQREIFGNMAFEIRWVGSRSDNLARGVDFAQIDVVNNGFLADFLRAQNNLRVGGNAFCATAGCVPLQIFQNGGTPAPGRIVVSNTSGILVSTFNNALSNGTVVDLATSIISQSSGVTGGLNNVNNQPCIGSQRNAAGTVIYTCNPAATPYLNFLPNNSTGVVDFFLNDAYHNYNSLQAELRKRFSNGLYFQANYTFSKNLTNASGTSQALFEPYLDNNNKELDKQRADFDTTHVFNFNGVYQLPFGSGKQFLNYGGGWDKLFGGWEISGLAQWQTGAPITFVDTRGTLNRSGRSARQTPNSNLTNDEIRSLMGIFEQNGNIYWINPSILLQTQNANGTWSSTASQGYSLTGTTFAGQAFFNTNPGQTGNIGRMLVNGPKYFNINAALLKSIRFTERMRVQLRLEAFNVLNNVNFVQNTQFANINSTNFGQITTSYGPREIQWAARFEW